MCNQNECQACRELPVQNVDARAEIQAHDDIHRVRGDQPGNPATMRGRTGIQETGQVHRGSGDPPESILDRHGAQGNPGTVMGTTAIQETGDVHRVMCLIRGDVVLNEPPGLD